MATLKKGAKLKAGVKTKPAAQKQKPYPSKKSMYA